MASVKTIPGGSDVGCHGCAFRATADTRKEPWNVIRSQVCVEGAVPFYCHEGIDNWEKGEGNVTREQRQRMKLCAGWKAAVLKRSRNTKWRELRKIKHLVAELCLGALTRWADEKADPVKKAEYERRWKAMFRMLFDLSDEMGR